MGDSTNARVHAGEELKVLVPSNGARRVGRYLLCDQIGSGGMATIHLARLLGPQGFSRTVAIKQLHPQFAQNPQFVAMLLDEARLAVRVRHVNVVSPLDIVATESELFIVMDYVSGESLANLLAASDVPPGPAIAAAILVQVLLGLHAAHEATREQGDALGLVHRDVSPQNILVGQDGVARMVDFGIAKAVARTQTTDGGMVKGKLGYMAPEQIRLEVVDRRTDLFSAGVVLWEALTGTGLFVADTLGGSIQQILNGEIAPPSRFNPAVTPELDAVVLKALERSRDARFQDALSMAAALQRATPVAGALEVMDWVEKHAGPELQRRAGLVKRAEAVHWEASAEAPARESLARESVAPTGATAQPLAASSAGARPGWGDPVDVSRPLRRTPTLLGIAQPGTGRGPSDVTGATLIATGESTGIAVGGDIAIGESRLAAAASAGKRRPAWKSWGMGLGILLAGITTAFGVVALTKGDRRDSFAIARQPLSVEPAKTVDINDPPVRVSTGSASSNSPGGNAPPNRAPTVEAPSPSPPHDAPAPSASAPGVRAVRSEPPSAALDSEPALDEVNDASDDAHSSRARRGRATRGERSAASARPGAARRSAAAKKAESKPSRPSAAASEAPLPHSTRDACDPPWVVNAQQVKVFKAECLR